MICDTQAEKDFVQVVLSLAEESPGALNVNAVADGISEGCFTDSFRWKTYLEAKSHARRGERLTSESLAALLGPQERENVVRIWPVIPVSGGYRSLAAKLRDYATRRAANEISIRIKEAAHDPTSQLAQSLVQAASALQGAFSGDGTSIVNGKSVLSEFVDKLERVQLGSEQLAIQTGLPAWDECVGGLSRKFVTLVGAYPGAFKSGLCATIAANVAASGRKVGFFSLEDNAEFVAKRYVSAKTGIPVQDMGRRKLSEFEMTKMESAFDVVLRVMGNIEFDHRSGLTGGEVAASARFLVAEKKCDLIIIDHIGEVRPPSGGRTDKAEWLGDAFKMIRDVAKDTGCAILCAAHLRRRDDSEEDIYRVPRLTDFSDSSAMEKACRVALGLYQPRDNPGEVALRVLKQNEGDGRGKEIRLKKRLHCALVE